MSELVRISDCLGQPKGGLPRGALLPDDSFINVVCVMLFRSNGSVVFSKNLSAKGSKWGGKWQTAAAGHVGANETPVKAAGRELAEETGVRAEISQYVGTIRRTEKK
ncbi:MAG: NUDIX hydrolase, partial [Rickettsiales bacterium]|nr:NUDIX hydrolase [Rickettsiales bacterium]